MDKRWAGMLILVIVVLLAAAVPNVIGKPIAGQPVAEQVPGPPGVGDCVTLPRGTSPVRAHGPGAVPRVPQTCAAEHFGEVAALIHSGRPTPTMSGNPDDGPGTMIDDSNRMACADAVWRYLGVPVGADHVPTLNTYWSPVAFADATAFGPTERQQAAGQTWLACVLRLEDNTGTPPAYTGSTRNGYASGTMPTQFSLCLYSANLTGGDAGPCRAPHPVEVFGATSTAKVGLTQQLLDSSCRELVRRLTRMADPTARGQLQVKALAVHGDHETPSPGLGSAADQTGFAACVVVAPETHRLAESLLGLGTKPVPWSS